MIYIINCQFLNYYMAVPVGGCIVHCICAVEAVLVRNSKTKALKTPKLTGRLRLPRATHGPLLTGHVMLRQLKCIMTSESKANCPTQFQTC